MPVRKIIEIDEKKCTGCGNCIPGCAEGALAIVDGKAKIIKDMYCDGLGACLGHCPEDALKVIEREAEDFDEEAAMEHVARQQEDEKRAAVLVAEGAPDEEVRVSAGGGGCGCQGGKLEEFGAPKTMGCGCSGALIEDFGPRAKPVAAPCPCMGGDEADEEPGAESGGQPEETPPGNEPSELTHWPVQIRLVPPDAPFLKGADLLIAADCAPVAYAGFHKDFVRDRKVLIGCPKFDQDADYLNRLTALFREARPKSVTVLRMEVPCCAGLSKLVRRAMEMSGADSPVSIQVVTRQGNLGKEQELASVPA